MENNLFTDSQLRQVYSDKGFLEFISEYYSSYNTKMINISGEMSRDEVDEFWKIYIRILLANINDVMTAIEKIEKNISFSYDEVIVKVSGGIRGRLLINDYVKNKSMVRLPREYPCVIKEKSYQTIENEYLVYIVKQIADKLQNLIDTAVKSGTLNGQETEHKLLQDSLDYFTALLRKNPFINIFSSAFARDNRNGFSNEKKSLIYSKVSKGKIRNAFAYSRVFDWYEKFCNVGFTWLDEVSISMLIYADDFCNKLFELWNLYYIANTFQNSFNMELLDRKPIRPGLNDYVYKLKSIENSVIEIYYQKGKGLYWNDELKQNWHYINDNDKTKLIGIPDISVKYIADEENITLIDLKNRFRNTGQNSEEIYKIIGYFSNFGKFLNNYYNTKYKNQAILIFRNDDKGFEEHLESDSGERILSISTGINGDPEAGRSQFVKICRYILDVQGITGAKSETISSCNKSFNGYKNKLEKAVESNDENAIEDIIYDMEKQNHTIIKDMFSVGDLQDILELKRMELKTNHFPHIWSELNEDTINTLAMAECLFSGLAPCIVADYAPVCLEFCRAVEIQLNDLIFTPFKKSNNIKKLATNNRNYNKLQEDRDLTLGECIFLLEKCTSNYFQTIELYNFVKVRVANYSEFLGTCQNLLKQINVSVRRKAAHTTIMTYDELLEARQKVLGIGNTNIFYTLLDKR